MCSLSDICLTCVYCDNIPPCHCSCTGDASVLFISWLLIEVSASHVLLNGTAVQFSLTRKGGQKNFL